MPAAISLGAAVPVGGGALVVAPFVAPQWVYSYTWAAGESESEGDYGIAAGVNLLIGNVPAGVGLTKLGPGDSASA